MFINNEQKIQQNVLLLGSLRVGLLLAELCVNTVSGSLINKEKRQWTRVNAVSKQFMLC